LVGGAAAAADGRGGVRGAIEALYSFPIAGVYFARKWLSWLCGEPADAAVLADERFAMRASMMPAFHAARKRPGPLTGPRRAVRLSLHRRLGMSAAPRVLTQIPILFVA